MHVKAREYFDRLLRENQSVHKAIMGVQTVVLQLYALLTNVFYNFVLQISSYDSSSQVRLIFLTFFQRLSFSGGGRMLKWNSFSHDCGEN